jgi:hypothetical protein
MRRNLLIGGCALALLLFGIGLLFVKRETSHNHAPPNAINMRVYRHGLSEVHISYQLPAAGKLSDLYEYYSARGWVRDRLTERSLQRPLTDIPTTVFAIFTQHRLFGLVSEIAIIGVPTDTRFGVNVRQVRCFKIEPWIGCL